MTVVRDGVTQFLSGTPFAEKQLNPRVKWMSASCMFLIHWDEKQVTLSQN